MGQPIVRTAERDGWRFRITNPDQFARIWQDVAEGHEYEMGDLGPAPVVVDAGAHVGVASHWLARRHPDALVLAFEANPHTFDLLRENIAANGLADRVRVHRTAIGPRTEPTAFYVTPGEGWGDTAVRQQWRGDEQPRRIVVPALALAALLDRPVDLLKLDIEGVETETLAAAAHRLGNVRRLVLEFHGARANPGNRLEDLLATLRAAGFATRVEQDGQPVAPERVRRDDPFWVIVRAWRPGDGWAPADPPRRRWFFGR